MQGQDPKPRPECKTVDKTRKLGGTAKLGREDAKPDGLKCQGWAPEVRGGTQTLGNKRCSCRGSLEAEGTGQQRAPSGLQRGWSHSLHVLQVGQLPLGQVPLPGLIGGAVPPNPGPQLDQLLLPGCHAHELLGAEVLQLPADGCLLGLHHLLHEMPLDVLGEEVGPRAVCRDSGQFQGL